MHDEAVMGTEESRACLAAPQPSATSAGESRRDRMTDLTRGGGVPRVFVVTREERTPRGWPVRPRWPSPEEGPVPPSCVLRLGDVPPVRIVTDGPGSFLSMSRDHITR